MTDNGTFILDFVNRARGVQAMPPLRFLVVGAARRWDQRECLLARALGCEVGGSNDAAWQDTSRWVMRFGDPAVSRQVAKVTEQKWLPHQAEVTLPEVLVDFAISFDLGLIEHDWTPVRRVQAWLVPQGGHKARGIGPGFKDGPFHRFAMPCVEAGGSPRSAAAA